VKRRERGGRDLGGGGRDRIKLEGQRIKERAWRNQRTHGSSLGKQRVFRKKTLARKGVASQHFKKGEEVLGKCSWGAKDLKFDFGFAWPKMKKRQRGKEI